MRILAIANQKGGCGKTTIAINLAATLAREGRRVLLVDLDPQGHCAVGMAVPEEQMDLSIYDCLTTLGGPNPVEIGAIAWQITPNLDLAPAKQELGRFELQPSSGEDRETRLERVLAAADGKYEYAVLDCPPHIGLLTRNALRAASDVIIPVDTGYFSLHGLTQQLRTLDELSAEDNRRRHVRVLANQYDVRTKLAREILAELRERFDGVMFRTIINFNTKLKEGISFGQPITEFAPTSMGARDFQKLAREVIETESVPAAADPAPVSTEMLLERAEAMAAEAERLLATTTTLVGRHENGRMLPENVPTSTPSIQPPRQVGSQTQNPPREWGARGTEASATPEEIARKLERIYGVEQTAEGIVLRSHHPDAASVQLAGDFNNWTPSKTPMQRTAVGDFEARLRLPTGKYRYRVVIDGRWSHDPHNPSMELNEFGELNSILTVN